METGKTAGKIYKTLEKTGSLKLDELKKKVKTKNLDYSLGWLMREEKIVLQTKGKTMIISLK